MKRWIDFSRGYAYISPDRAPLRILPGGSRSCLPRLILYPRNSNPCRTCTIRVFCGCSCTPNSLRIRSAAATAARASSADVQVTTQSSAYLAPHLLIERRQEYVTEQGRNYCVNAKDNFEFNRTV